VVVPNLQFRQAKAQALATFPAWLFRFLLLLSVENWGTNTHTGPDNKGGQAVLLLYTVATLPRGIMEGWKCGLSLWLHVFSNT